MQGDTVAPLRDFVVEMTQLISKEVEESIVLLEGQTLLKNLVKTDT